ncbi:MAG: preprotein translocase subunit SecG [Kiritimatiellaeota bacterium]|nr:preprotein translocase subunit SecG [Kiritimatiellota bacterium]
MSILISVLYVVEVIVCFLLGGIVMLQKPKDGGLNAAISGGMGEAFFGAQVGNVLVKATIILGTVFLANTLLLSCLTAHGRGDSVMRDVRTPPPAEQSQPLPFSQGMPTE